MTMQEWHFEVEFRGTLSEADQEAVMSQARSARFGDDGRVVLRLRARADGFYSATSVLNSVVYGGAVGDLKAAGVLSDPVRVVMLDDEQWLAREAAELGLPVGSSREELNAAFLAQVVQSLPA